MVSTNKVSSVKEKINTIKESVSDLIYVNVSGKWNYIWLLSNLFNRKIVEYSAGDKNDASRVDEAFMNTNKKLSKVKIR